ncbi:MAG: tetratricopeptide repeat protein [bacterium]
MCKFSEFVSAGDNLGEKEVDEMWTNRQKACYNRPSHFSGGLRIVELIVLVLVALHTLPMVVDASPVHDLAAEGDSAYRAGQYERAIDIYQRVITGGYVSGPLLYNMGNAWYKRGDLGRAILYYERAKRMMPHNRDVRYNLDLARSRTVDRIEQPPRLPIWDLVDTFRDLISRELGARLAWVITLAAALAFAALLSVRGVFRRGLRILTLTFSVLALVALLLVSLRVAADHGPPQAVILVDKVSLHSAPDPTSLEVFSLHTGTTITIVKQLEDWWEVRLTDGRQGWMPGRAGEIVQAF